MSIPVEPTVTPTRHLYVYESIGAIMDAAEMMPECGNAYGTNLQSRSKPKTPAWDYNAGWDGAITLAREGWPKGREQISKIADSMREEVLQGVAPLEAPEFVHDVAGAFVDVPAHLARDPESMVSWVPVEQDRPVVRLLISIGGSAGVNATAFNRRGAAAAALVDLLEMTGRRCEIIACSYTEQGVAIRLTVKRPEHPLDMDAIAYWLAHPAAFRRIFFAAKEHATPADRKKINCPDGGYGKPANITKSERRGAVHVPTMLGSNMPDDLFGPAWLREQLRSQGVELVPRLRRDSNAAKPR